MGRGPSQESLNQLVKNMENHGGYQDPSWLQKNGYLKEGGHSPEIGQEPVPSDLNRIMKGLTDYKDEVPDTSRVEMHNAQDCVNLIHKLNEAKKTAARKVPLRQSQVSGVVSEYAGKLDIVGKCPGVLPGEVAYFVRIEGKTPLAESKGKLVYLERLIDGSDGRQVGMDSEQYRRGVFAEAAKSILLNSKNVPDLPAGAYAEVLGKESPELSDTYMLILRPVNK